MILFCNTFITETKPFGKGKVVRGNLKAFSNFNIFKYSLASLAVAYPWSKVILKISLDEIYKPRQKELEEFIKDEFKGFKLHLEWERNVYQNDWKRDYDLLDNDLIWFYCNHDHIFFDSSQDYLISLVEKMRNEKMCSLHFSHWPEWIRSAKSGGESPPFDPSTYQIYDDHLSIMSTNFDSIQIITKDLYYEWWCTGDFNHVRLPRPDFFGIGLAEIKSVPNHKLIIPLKEICRHFDGYQHRHDYPITNDQCPAIDIPLGFFDNNIKIKYGFDDYMYNYTNINPVSKDYYAYDTNGTDYKFTLDDLPLVWKSRISSIECDPNIDKKTHIQYRLKSVLEMMYTSEHFEIDEEVEEKVLSSYLKPFNYTI